MRLLHLTGKTGLAIRLLLLGACSDAHDGSNADVPDSWQRVQGSCGVSLRAPALVATRVEGTDSCVAAFEGPDCSYNADVGAFSDTLQYDSAQFTMESTTVDGKRARLVTSRGRVDNGQRYFVGIHVPLRWPHSSGVSATIAAYCFSAGGADTARRVLQTVDLPDDAADSALAFGDAASCTGEDIRPITGYLLGKSCVDAKVEVPGICALGARAHATTGSGAMVCFVSPDGDYFWAQVAYGEVAAGPGSRRGAGALQATQLDDKEEAKCQELVAELQESATNTLTGERSYRACE